VTLLNRKRPETARPAKAVKKAVKKRVMSEEGRQRIGEATGKRWASVRKAAKKAALEEGRLAKSPSLLILPGISANV
jgi:hypothetical protein